MKIDSGSVVLLTLHSPRERHIGVLHEISAAGVFLRTVEFDYFDEWSRAIAGGDVFLKLNESFFPMWRVERVALDEPVADAPSMAELFERRTGRVLSEF